MRETKNATGKRVSSRPRNKNRKGALVAVHPLAVLSFEQLGQDRFENAISKDTDDLNGVTILSQLEPSSGKNGMVSSPFEKDSTCRNSVAIDHMNSSAAGQSSTLSPVKSSRKRKLKQLKTNKKAKRTSAEISEACFQDSDETAAPVQRHMIPKNTTSTFVSPNHSEYCREVFLRSELDDHCYFCFNQEDLSLRLKMFREIQACVADDSVSDNEIITENNKSGYTYSSLWRRQLVPLEQPQDLREPSLLSPNGDRPEKHQSELVPVSVIGKVMLLEALMGISFFRSESDSNWDGIYGCRLVGAEFEVTHAHADTTGADCSSQLVVSTVECPTGFGRNQERAHALRLLEKLQEAMKRRRTVSKNLISTDIVMCEICHQIFTARASLRNHILSHAGIKPFECSICNATFTRLSSLKYHELKHANAFRFKCRYCERGFRAKHSCTEHERSHTGETPFQCLDCLKPFCTRNSYKRHLKFKHGVLLTADGSMDKLSEEEFARVRTRDRKKVATSKAFQDERSGGSDCEEIYELRGAFDSAGQPVLEIILVS